MPVGEEYVFEVGGLFHGQYTTAQANAEFTKEYAALRALPVPAGSKQLTVGDELAERDLRDAIAYTAGRSRSTDFRQGAGILYLGNSCNFARVP